MGDFLKNAGKFGAGPLGLPDLAKVGNVGQLAQSGGVGGSMGITSGPFGSSGANAGANAGKMALQMAMMAAMA